MFYISHGTKTQLVKYDPNLETLVFKKDIYASKKLLTQFLHSV